MRIDIAARAPRRRRGMAVALAIFAIGIGLTACRVHELSTNDTDLPGVWRADFPISSSTRAYFTLDLVRTHGDSLGGGCLATTSPGGGLSSGCTVRGELRGDSVYLALPDYVGTFRGVWQSRYVMVGDLEFNFVTGRQRVTNAYFEKVGGI